MTFLLVIDSKPTSTMDVMPTDLLKKLFFQHQNFMLALNSMDLSGLILMCYEAQTSVNSLDFGPAVWGLEGAQGKHAQRLRM